MEKIEREENRRRASDYLLRRLSKEERESYEELYFTNPDVLEELEIVRQDLIDEYLRGELHGDDSSQFERLLFELPALLSDAEFTHSVIELAADRSKKDLSRAASSAEIKGVRFGSIVEVNGGRSSSLLAPFLSWFAVNNRRLIVLASLVIAALSFLIWRELLKSNEISLPHNGAANSNADSNANQQITTTLQEQDGNRNNSLANSTQNRPPDSHKPDNQSNRRAKRQPQPPIAPSQESQPTLAKSFTLTHTAMATKGGNLLIIEPDNKNVQFIIPQTRGNPNETYRVVVRDADGAQQAVYESGSLVLHQDLRGSVLVLTIRSDLLTAQYYVLSIYLENNGRQELDKFSFRVDRK